MTTKDTPHASMLDESLGQVFTPKEIVEQMIGLKKNHGRTLEPSSGMGHIARFLPKDTVTIEYDSTVAEVYKPTHQMDFFSFLPVEPFDSIVGNPPYLQYKQIEQSVIDNIKNHVDDVEMFNEKTNLYVFFMKRCIDLLSEGGELIFLIPKDYLAATSCAKFNTWMLEVGSYTHIISLGDRCFNGASPDVVLIRYVKGLRSNTLEDGRFVTNTNGVVRVVESLLEDSYRLGDKFKISVGIATGNNTLYLSKEGDQDVIVSYTKAKGEVGKIFSEKAAETALLAHKEELENTYKVQKGKKQWFEYLRGIPTVDKDCIFVNCKTRDPKPFFTAKGVRSWDSSVMALIPLEDGLDLEKEVELLNNVDWSALGFQSAGKYEFNQKVLSNTLLPK